MATDLIAAAKELIALVEKEADWPSECRGGGTNACIRHGPDLARLCVEQAARIERLEAAAGELMIPISNGEVQSDVLNGRFWPAVERFRSLLAGSAPVATSTPIDALLFCPKCNEQHIDAPLALAMAERLLLGYRFQPVEVAKVCDETIDPSGNLLGWLRDYAKKENHDAK